ncbi:MAG: aldo/keto reductase [Spirochaetota bacterium]|nr:aldo/keto reductase [Spirochaetota bacterium]
MPDLNEKQKLGNTDLYCGRLGISSSFAAPAAAFEMAFERGCNYFSWGTFMKGRSSEMKKAIRAVVKAGKRDELVISIYSYAHQRLITEYFYKKGLKDLGVDYADELVLGYYPGEPSGRMMDKALELKEKGLVRYIGLSGHNRKNFPKLHEKGLIDIHHIRYNPANRGAETDCFEKLVGERKPGIVTFTATRWGQLLSPKKMPSNAKPLLASECYRFCLSHSAVDICMMGAKNLDEMGENLKALDQGPLSEEEMLRVSAVGDYVYSKGFVK